MMPSKIYFYFSKNQFKQMSIHTHFGCLEELTIHLCVGFDYINFDIFSSKDLCPIRTWTGNWIQDRNFCACLLIKKSINSENKHHGNGLSLLLLIHKKSDVCTSIIGLEWIWRGRIVQCRKTFQGYRFLNIMCFWRLYTFKIY